MFYIIATRGILEIGKEYKGVYNVNGVDYPNQPLKVIRESNGDDWERQCIERGTWDEKRVNITKKYANFYEVSVD